jgi:long-chain acyl-CoA synthetase
MKKRGGKTGNWAGRAMLNPHKGQLDVRASLNGKRLLVMGGTGFLGKVWLSTLMRFYPEVGHIHLVVRAKKNTDGTVRQSSTDRFWAEVAPSAVFDPVREQFPGPAYEAMLRARITVIPGDVTEEFAGVPIGVRDGIRGQIDAIVNASGVVDFNPPLDYALNVNAFGMQNLVALARDLGRPGSLGVPFLHTSTAYVAGDRTGEVKEGDPRAFPFPRAHDLDRTHWDPEREIAECVDLVDNVRHRSDDAFRQSDFLSQAKQNLLAKNEPSRGRALAAEVKRVKRRFEEQQLVDWGTERAKFWGWHNIYTYTKAIGEQILASSGVPFAICRPAVIESAVAYPRVGWCEGINTSAPLIYLVLKGPIVFPRESETVLDIIPVDQVAIGMILALAELLIEEHEPVYHMGTSDSNPLHIDRLIELVGLFKRKHHLEFASGNPMLNWVQARMEPSGATPDVYFDKGPKYRSEKLGAAAKWLGRFAKGALQPMVEPAVDTLQTLSKQLEIQARITDQFVPFMATHNYRFCCDNVRRAYSRLDVDEQRVLDWCPEKVDWRDYILEVHGPGVRANVSPLIDAKLVKTKKPLKTHDDLISMIDEVAERYDLCPALLRTHTDGFTRVSYRDLRARSIAAAARLQAAGVGVGDRVLLAGANHPDWVIAYFGIVRAGAVAVPVDLGFEPVAMDNIIAASGAIAAVFDVDAADRFGVELDVHLFQELTAPNATEVLVAPSIQTDTLASILYTSGTTGQPKGVMLSHGNFCAILASVGRLFPLTAQDRLLSVLPLHHAFEFACGLLLPLSMGARIIYLDRIDGDRLGYGLQAGKVTCMVGVPALWQLLERRIRGQISQKGPLFNLAFDAGLELNREVGRRTGLDLGKLMFGSVHDRLGGNIRLLISGGAALPGGTQTLFQGLGLHLSEGYGLTEASPVLAVSTAGPGSRPGTVGRAIPGVELRIQAPDDKGVGEVLARGDNIMLGYFGDAAATAETIDGDGWLHTGDMGRLDHKGRLHLVGRAKEVVVTAAGENIYLEDVEQRLGAISSIEEYTFLGLDDDRGGERLGMLARPKAGVEYARAKRAIQDALADLVPGQRPAVIHLVTAPLPRTATRKVQRKKARVVLEKIVRATPTLARGETVAAPVARAIAVVAGVDVSAVNGSVKLSETLGFDSLMWVELASALEGIAGHLPSVTALSECETVADVVVCIGAPPATEQAKDPAAAPLPVPIVVAKPLKAGLGVLQRALNGAILRTRVLGRANIPNNRATIVVCNHTSHLDMGLVKYALGTYGEGMTALAAKDYFFEGNRWKVAYFEHLTNVTPIDRKSGFRTSLRQAQAVIQGGQVVLIFPEGTRQRSGATADFKPLVGKLCLETSTDILPIHIEGAYAAMPKGKAILRARDITVRIGPPLCVDDLLRLTAEMKPAHAARHVAKLARTAVDRLSEGGVLDVSRMESEAAEAVVAEPEQSPAEVTEESFRSLPAKFSAERVDRPMSWYFSLGDVRWTVIVNEEGCTVTPGRPPGGQADCVVKSSTEIVNKLIQHAFVPGPSEFVSGAIKTNDIPALIAFSRVFDLNDFQG